MIVNKQCNRVYKATVVLFLRKEYGFTNINIYFPQIFFEKKENSGK